MINVSVDTVRALDPALARHVEHLNMVGVTLANAEKLNKQGDNSVEFSRFYGSLIYRLEEEQKNFVN